MGALIRALRRLGRVLGFKMAGHVDEAADALATDPHAVRATYVDIVRDQATKVDQIATAHANRVTQQQVKLTKLKELTADVERLENLKSGAAAKAKKRVAELQAAGKTQAEIQGDAEYLKCSGAFRDFSTTLTEKEARITELEQGVANDEESIKRHLLNMQAAKRELDRLAEEGEDTVSDILVAKQEQAAAAIEAGIATNDRAAEDRRRMQQLRMQAKSKAKTLQQLAGTDTRVAEEEFLEYANASAANDEFAQLTGLAAKADAAPVTAAPTATPVADAAAKGGGLPG